MKDTQLETDSFLSLKAQNLANLVKKTHPTVQQNQNPTTTLEVKICFSLLSSFFFSFPFLLFFFFSFVVNLFVCYYIKE